jgi:hypothetical protein
MLPTVIRRVMVAEHRTDFRKRFDGLLGESYRLGADPYAGDCIVFLKSDRTQLRALTGDRLGLFLVCRRFEGGSLRANFTFAREPSCTTITRAELSLMFEGATFTVHRRVREWKKV